MDGESKLIAIIVISLCIFGICTVGICNHYTYKTKADAFQAGYSQTIVPGSMNPVWSKDGQGD